MTDSVRNESEWIRLPQILDRRQLWPFERNPPHFLYRNELYQQQSEEPANGESNSGIELSQPNQQTSLPNSCNQSNENDSLLLTPGISKREAKLPQNTVQ